MSEDAVTSSVTSALFRVTSATNGTGPSRRLAGGTAPARTPSFRAESALRLLAAFRALRRAQLEALLFATDGLAPASRHVIVHRVLGQLRERGLVQTVSLPGPATTKPGLAYVLTPAGQRVYAAMDEAYPARRIRVPSTLLLEHAVALADIALAFLADAERAQDIDLWWETDWEAGIHLGTSAVIPDAFVTLERAGWRAHACIEADRATEREGAFARKLLRYVDLYRADAWRRRLDVWPLILTVTTSEAHARSLARLAERVTVRQDASRITHAFRFASLSDVRGKGVLASIWHVPARLEPATILDLPSPPDEDLHAPLDDTPEAAGGMC